MNGISTPFSNAARKSLAGVYGRVPFRGSIAWNGPDLSSLAAVGIIHQLSKGYATLGITEIDVIALFYNSRARWHGEGVSIRFTFCKSAELAAVRRPVGS
jgi:hypothetical protein